MNHGEPPPQKHQNELRTEQRGALGCIFLCRPAQRNALSRSLTSALTRAVEELTHDKSVQCIVITGEGRAFCAGADLKERLAMGLDEVRAQLDAFARLMNLVDICPKPVIALLNGPALGGGFELALACDFRLASPSARVGLPEVSLGIIPGAGGTVRLSRLVGPARAKELVLFARQLTAEQAHEAGLVHALLPEGKTERDPTERDLMGHAEAWAKPLLTAAPLALSAALEAIDASAAGLTIHDALAAERRCYERVLESEDRVEALRAFADKRAPLFTGRLRGDECVRGRGRVASGPAQACKITLLLFSRVVKIA